MSICLSKGLLTISLDLDAENSPAGKVDRQRDQATTRLVELLNEFQLPATCAVWNPAASTIAWRLASAPLGHEIAIMGAASRVTAGDRAHEARELQQRLSQAEAAGVHVSTLVLRHAQTDECLELAVKRGLTAVRHETSAIASKRRPQMPRFGLWSFPVSLALPGASRWLPGGGGTRAARRALDLAIAGQTHVQLVIDVPRLATVGRAAERVLRRVFELAANRRQQGQLDVVTIRAAANRLASQNQGQPSRSILRPAA